MFGVWCIVCMCIRCLMFQSLERMVSGVSVSLVFGVLYIVSTMSGVFFIYVFTVSWDKFLFFSLS